jgi:hypothetical protein
MCYGLSGFYHKNGSAYFIEPDDGGNVSHHEVLERMPESLKKDGELIPFEFPEWTIKSFRWDYPGKIPTWADKQKCGDLLRKVKPVWIKYKKVWNAAYAKREKICDAAWDKYEKVCDPARITMIEELCKIDGYVKEGE